MTNTYVNQLINEFDQEFESLVFAFPEPFVVTTTYTTNAEKAEENENNQEITAALPDTDAAEKLNKIKALATEISAERYNHNYNPEICLANLLNFILADDNQDMENDFFQLLNQDHNINLDQALNEFDFYLNNPYKKKAEKILSKIEARKNK
ncbi:MAG: hypothetical protein J5598_01125 [Clostridia bacterium]|nr:hypothetical protein [Clostridia bacterium]